MAERPKPLIFRYIIMPINDLVQFRKGTASAWTTANPVLASGEPGFDVTNNILKVGTGSSPWSSLSPLFSGLYISGTGTSGYLNKWNSTSSITNSIVYDNGTNIGIGTNNPAYKLDVAGSGSFYSLNINNQFTLPSTDGSIGQFLSTNGSGVVSWTNPSSTVRGYEILSSGKSVFNVSPGYDTGNLDVYYNGLKLLVNDDYTASNGTSFSLNNPAASGDIIEWIGSSTIGASFALSQHTHLSSEITFASGTPASATAVGIKGQILWDNNYLYVCVNTNTWKRSAITSW
jgi:hypothetical protein